MTSATSGANGAPTILANALVVDIRAGRVREADVRIDGERITAVGPRLPRDGAAVRDLAGTYVMPGLVSIHTHPGVMAGFRTDANGLDPARMRRDLALWLRFGVTTVQSMGLDRDFAFDVARAQSPAEARLLSVGHGFGVADAVPQFRMEPPGPLRLADRRAIDDAIKAQAGGGATGVKLWYDDWYGQYPKMALEVARAIIEAAASHGLRSYAHIYRVDDAKDLVRAGVRTLAHMPRDRVADEELWALMRERDVALVPTLIVPDSNIVWLDAPAFVDDRLFRAAAGDDGAAYVRSDAYLASIRAKPEFGRLRQDLADAMANVGAAYRAGVRFGFGTDAGVSQRTVGYGEHRELELLVASGVRPADAIRMATLGAAEVLGRDDLGEVAVGKCADLVVLDESPLASVRSARRIRAVWRDGHEVAGPL